MAFGGAEASEHAAIHRDASFIALNPSQVNGLDPLKMLASPLIAQSSTPTQPVTTVRDDFHRADTAAGQLGSSAKMAPWRLSGAGWATTLVHLNQFTNPSGLVYAYQRFWAAPYVMRAAIAWILGSGGAGTVALITSIDNNLIFNMVHVQITPTGCLIQKRINQGAFINIGGGSWGSACATDGTIFLFTVAYNYTTSTLTVTGPDGTVFTATDPDIKTLAGPWCTWELTNGGGGAIEARIAMASADLPLRWSPKAYREVILADNPLAYWPLDDMDSANAANSSLPMDNAGANLRPGTNGGVGLRPTDPGLVVGDLSTAYGFDGTTAYVGLNNPAALQLTTGSFEVLVKTDDNRTGDHGLMGKYNAYVLEVIGGVLKLRDFTGGVRDTGVYVADNLPHHYGVTFQSGVASGTLVYVDGRLMLTTTLTVVDQTWGWTMMSSQIAAVWCARGTAGHGAIYSTILTPAQMLAHANAALATS